MSEQPAPPVEERLRQLLHYLGIDKAHFAGRVPEDWVGLATRFPVVLSSMTVIGGFDPRTVEHLATRLLAVIGDRGRNAGAVLAAMPRLPDAELVTLRDYEIFAWSDLATDRTEELATAMLQFLASMSSPADQGRASLAEGSGEFDGISYRIREPDLLWCCCRCSWLHPNGNRW